MANIQKIENNKDIIGIMSMFPGKQGTLKCHVSTDKRYLLPIPEETVNKRTLMNQIRELVEKGSKTVHLRIMQTKPNGDNYCKDFEVNFNDLVFSNSAIDEFKSPDEIQNMLGQIKQENEHRMELFELNQEIKELKSKIEKLSADADKYKSYYQKYKKLAANYENQLAELNDSKEKDPVNTLKGIVGTIKTEFSDEYQFLAGIIRAKLMQKAGIPLPEQTAPVSLEMPPDLDEQTQDQEQEADELDELYYQWRDKNNDYSEDLEIILKKSLKNPTLLHQIISLYYAQNNSTSSRFSNRAGNKANTSSLFQSVPATDTISIDQVSVDSEKQSPFHSND